MGEEGGDNDNNVNDGHSNGGTRRREERNIVSIFKNANFSKCCHGACYV